MRRLLTRPTRPHLETPYEVVQDSFHQPLQNFVPSTCDLDYQRPRVSCYVWCVVSCSSSCLRSSRRRRRRRRFAEKVIKPLTLTVPASARTVPAQCPLSALYSALWHS